MSVFSVIAFYNKRVMVPAVGLEPTRLATGDFESPVYTNFTTLALPCYNIINVNINDEAGIIRKKSCLAIVFLFISSDWCLFTHFDVVGGCFNSFSSHNLASWLLSKIACLMSAARYNLVHMLFVNGAVVQLARFSATALIFP